MCPIEEYAKSARKWVWVRPPNPPTKALITPIVDKMGFWDENEEISNIKGAIFCQVINRAAEAQGTLFITEGNQKWKGAAPSLVVNPNMVNIVKLGESIPIKRSLLPKAWNNKYFKEASDSWNQLEEERMGIKEIIFSSRAIQTINQWEEERAITVLEVMVNKNKLI